MEELIKLAKNEIPSVDVILNETWETLQLKKDFVRSHFGKVLVSFDVEATKIFRSCERKALVKLAKSWLNLQKAKVKKKFESILTQKGWDKFVEEATNPFVEFGILVQNLEKDLGNMRKARGGKTFEKTILKLLDFINVAAETPAGSAKEKLRRIDIVVPSVEVALNTPDRAIFLTCKRTLRERWKQEVPQARLN